MTDPNRDDLLRWDRTHVWHAFTQMAEYEPLLIERGQGCRVQDIDGRWYLDGTSSLWCNVHGHRHPRLDAALAEQLQRIAHTTSLGASNSQTIRLARRLVEVSPPGLEHVFFSDDGATAVEVSLKLAFQYWRQCPRPRPEKSLFVMLDDAYHGDTLGAVSVGGVQRFQQMFQPLLFPTRRLPAPHPYRPPPGVAPADVVAYCLDRLECLLRDAHERIAAVVLEPLVQAAAGIIVHPPGFLRGVRELTRRFDVLLIADEVATGFGRTGTLFACEHEEVSPDLMCLAKGITGGYLPLAATLASSEIWSAFLGSYSESRSFFHGHTYGGNPLAAAVALASLDVFEEDQVLARVADRAELLAARLQPLADHPHVGDIRQRGLMVGIELVRDRATCEPFAWEERLGWQVCMAARQRGVLVRPLGNVVVLMPPLAISADEIEELATTVIAAIAEVLEADAPPENRVP